MEQFSGDGKTMADTAAEFLARHPDTVWIEAFAADLNGVLRGKRLAAADLAPLLRAEMRMRRADAVMDIWGRDVPGSGLVFQTGDPDGVCAPITETLAPVPWRLVPTAQLLLEIREAGGQALYCSPRQVLRRVVERVVALGLQPVVALELEFYLVERRRDATGLVQPVRNPASGRPVTFSRAHDLAAVAEFDALFRDLNAVCAAQGLPATTVLSEGGAGQFEVNLAHTADPVLAADQALLLKRAVKGVAESHGVTATFMARPFTAGCGSGMHVHCSLLDGAGSNAFDARSELGGETLAHAVAGVLALLPEATALLCPHANSYRRLISASHAPTSANWGYDNRSTAVRIPLSPPENRRVELRLAGADANPYLVLASVLAGVHHGLVHRLQPPEPVGGDGYARSGAALPGGWEEAMALLQRGAILPEYLSAQFCHAYAACKWQEITELREQISPFEYDTYLSSV